MTELTLSRDERLALKARAHHLDPVVLLGAAGLSDAVVKEIDRALNAHALIKIRVPGDERDARETIFADLADRLGAARIQMIGKLLVLYRPLPEGPAEAAASGAERPPRRPAKSQAKSAARPSARSAAKPAAKPRSAKSPSPYPADRAAPRRSAGFSAKSSFKPARKTAGRSR